MKRLVAYDEDGNVVATLDALVARDEDGKAIGLIDFEAHESAGGRLRDVWNVGDAVRSTTAPALEKPRPKHVGNVPNPSRR